MRDDVLREEHCHWLQEVCSDHLILGISAFEEIECVGKLEAEGCSVELMHNGRDFCRHFCVSGDCSGWSTAPEENEVDALVDCLITVSTASLLLGGGRFLFLFLLCGLSFLKRLLSLSFLDLALHLGGFEQFTTAGEYSNKV